MCEKPTVSIHVRCRNHLNLITGSGVLVNLNNAFKFIEKWILIIDVDYIDSDLDIINNVSAILQCIF